MGSWRARAIFAEDFHGAGDSVTIQYCGVVSRSAGGGASATESRFWASRGRFATASFASWRIAREMRFWLAGARVEIAC